MSDPNPQRKEKRTLNDYRKALVRRTKLLWLKLRHINKESFVCPLCNFHGPFLTVTRWTGERRFAQCPNCGALERHRLQWLIMQQLAKRFDFSKMSMLHIAPEQCLGRLFRRRFGVYTTTDLSMPGVDVHADLTRLPFHDGEFDVVHASHVLEHIPADMKAISEIRRILRRGGFAVLPVPIFTDKTVEYGKPDPGEEHHVRSPGADYYNRYESFFSNIEKYYSYSFPPVHQPYIYQNKAVKQSPAETEAGVMMENKLVDIVPVCFV